MDYYALGMAIIIVACFAFALYSTYRLIISQVRSTPVQIHNSPGTLAQLHDRLTAVEQLTESLDSKMESVKSSVNSLRGSIGQMKKAQLEMMNGEYVESDEPGSYYTDQSESSRKPRNR